MRLYRLLLRLYPASFRAEYGEQMQAIFERDRAMAGRAGAIGLWLSAFYDVLINATRAHADILRQDLRWSFRALRRAPGFAAAAIAVMALGIGAATATYSILDRMLFRPLPYPEADRIVNLWQSVGPYTRTELSPGNYRDWRQASRSFESMAAWTHRSANLVASGEPARLDGAGATAGLFEVLGVGPLLGRTFDASDDTPKGSVPLVLSEALWRERFGADPAVLGREVQLDDVPSVIVGVMPRGFGYPNRRIAFWAVMRFVEDDYADRGNNYLKGVARLRDGVSVDQAQAELAVVAARLEREFPEPNAKTRANVSRLREEVGRQPRLLAYALFGAAICVLGIACANLAGLLLARSLSRRRELSVRAAMGAGRERLVRQLLTESLVLAFLGGGAGVALAWASGPLAARFLPDALPLGEVPPLDLRALLFALAATAATGILFGLAPALRARHHGASEGLREDARSGGSHRTERLRSFLVAGEVAASVVLLVGAALLLRALWKVQDTHPGFATENILTMRTALPLPRYGPTAERERVYRHVLTRIREMQGVESAAYISALPMVMRGGIWGVALEGRDPNEKITTSMREVTPDFFRTLGIPILRGRDVAVTDTARIPASDDEPTPAVALVSEAFAREAGVDPIGRKFRLLFLDATIVGVVGDIRVRGLESDSEPQIYLASAQIRDNALIGYIPKDLVIRTRLAPAALMPQIRRIVAEADPTLPISDVRSLEEIVLSDTSSRRLQARLVAAFAALALLLAAVGIHGLLAFTVSQKTREIGVRVALGARPGQVLEMILARSGRLALAGILVGVAGAWAGGRVLEALLAGLSPSDPKAMASAVGMAAAAALAGSLLPAVRALRVNPAKALRSE